MLRPALVLALSVAACDPGDPRTAEIVTVMTRADEPLLRSRPTLVAGKYARMAGAPYEFFRGTFPLFVHDVRSGRVDLSGLPDPDANGPIPLALGDVHVENFGTLLGADGVRGVEPNDLDAADRWPWSWDLARLAGAMALATRLSNAEDAAAHADALLAEPDVVRALVGAYVGALGAPRVRLVEGSGGPALDDLFQRAAEDEAVHAELDELTTLDPNGVRTLLRGVLDPSDPAQVAEDLPAAVLAALPAAVEAYRTSLASPPPPAELAVLDAVRQYGSGVASFPRVRMLLLVRGPTDDPADDRILQCKELADSGSLGFAPPGVYADDVGARVLAAAHAAWAAPDAEPTWGTTSLWGIPLQVRREAEGHKTIRIDRLEAELGTPAALEALAAALGVLLARVHSSDGLGALGLGPILGAELSPAADDLADVYVALAAAYADQALEDHARWVDALAAQGPTLGFVPSAGDAPPPHLAALFGQQP